MSLNVDSIVKLSFITGLGFGFIYLPAIVVVATYFDKKRAFASGIASCGAGFGTFILAPIINILDASLGWYWTLFILGVLVLFCIPLGILLKPIKGTNTPNHSTESREGTEETGDSGNNAIDCFGQTSLLLAKMGNGYIELLYDAKFILFVLSNLLTNIGFAVPYAYTVASPKKTVILLSRA